MLKLLKLKIHNFLLSVKSKAITAYRLSIIISILLAVAGILSFCYGNESMFFISTMAATFVAIIFWFFGAKIVATIYGEASEVFYLGNKEALEKLNEDKRQIQAGFAPLITLALFFAMANSLVVLLGIEYCQSSKYLWAVISLLVFSLVAGMRFPSKKKRPERAMIAAVVLVAVFSLGKNSWPISNFRDSYVGINARGTEISLDKSSKNLTRGIVEQGEYLWKEVNGVPVLDSSVNTDGLLVKVVGKVEVDGQILARVRLENIPNTTIKAKSFYIEPEKLFIGKTVVTKNYISVKKYRAKWMFFQTLDEELIVFKTDEKIHKNFRELKGKKYTISGFESGELLWNDIKAGEMCEVGFAEYTGVENSLMLQAKAGTVIKIRV